MVRSVTERVLRTALLVIAFGALGLVLLLNFLKTAEVSYDAYERVSLHPKFPQALLLLFIALFAVLILSLLTRYLERLPLRYLFFGLVGVYIVAALYIVLNVDVGIRADAWLTHDAARRVASGDYSPLAPEGYIQRYPHQIGLMLYDTVLQLFTENTAIYFFTNLLFVFGINATFLAISHTLFKDRLVDLITIGVSFAFLPQFFFIMFAYGLIPGFFFMSLGFLGALRFTRTGQWRYAVMTALGCALAATFKQNFLIGAIAVFIYLALDMLKACAWRARLRTLAVLLLSATVLLLPTRIITGVYREVSGEPLDEGTPTLAWVVMGTDIDNRWLGPGWYSGYNYSCYTDAGYKTEPAAEAAREALRKNIEKIKAEPDRATEFFLDKTYSQWCDPLFQSVWTGPLAHCNQHAHTPLLVSLYGGGEVEDAVATLARLVLLSVLGFSLLTLILRRTRTEGVEMLVLFFIGGLLFHTFWEGKSQYTYPYVFVLIPSAAFGIAWLAGKYTRLIGWVIPKIKERIAKK